MALPGGAPRKMRDEDAQASSFRPIQDIHQVRHMIALAAGIGKSESSQVPDDVAKPRKSRLLHPRRRDHSLESCRGRAP